jgi:hypothetical protein
MAAAAPTKPRAPMSHTVFKFFFASHMYGRLRARGPPHAPASCGRVEVHVVPVRVPVSGISAPRLTCTWLDSRAGCCVRSPPCSPVRIATVRRQRSWTCRWFGCPCAGAGSLERATRPRCACPRPRALAPPRACAGAPSIPRGHPRSLLKFRPRSRCSCRNHGCRRLRATSSTFMSRRRRTI